jgi:hypothetical protein
MSRILAFAVLRRCLRNISSWLRATSPAPISAESSATYAVRMVGDVRGRTVAVLGAGSIGLLNARRARSWGAGGRGDRPGGGQARARPGAGRRPRRRSQRRGCGGAGAPRVALARQTPRLTVASQSSIVQAIALALKGGTVVWKAYPRASRDSPASRAGPRTAAAGYCDVHTRGRRARDRAHR